MHRLSRNHHVHVTCPCGNQWADGMVYEPDTGASYLAGYEECPQCGRGEGELEVTDLDEIDIQERILEARGEDF